MLLGTKVSPFVWRVIWALKLKGLEYEFIEENLSNKSPLLLEMNPIDKTVPVLIHGGKPICESLIILQYIDETWPQNPILPKDPSQRASARFWAKFSEEKLCGPSRDAFYFTGEKQAKGVETMKEALGILESEIKGKKFFGGDEIGYVDIVVGWSAYWLQFVEYLPERCFHFNFWLTAMRTNGILAEEILPRDKEALNYLKISSGPPFEWYPGKGLRHKILKGKPKKGSKNAKPKIRTDTCKSLFNIFNSSQIGEEDDDNDEDVAEDLANLMGVNTTLHIEEDDGEEEDDKEYDQDEEEEQKECDVAKLPLPLLIVCHMFIQQYCRKVP
ncbi:hypothetical protein K7X08_036362 [Anisodus acutangulus]|uniref:glutathione transferase n=1 Tax=Anisodus acutangulus TaxID=402998 RepID=A0A9Q1QXZ7_9SOLA|nr:hypothetical protein K7X08_036362 [Anisodus acutangulus]